MPSNLKRSLGYFWPPGINREQRGEKLDSVYWITGDFAEAPDERLDPGTFLLLGNFTPVCSCALASDIDYICTRCHVAPRQGQRAIHIQGTLSRKRVVRDVYDPHDQGTPREINLSAPDRQDHKSTSNRRRLLKRETL